MYPDYNAEIIIKNLNILIWMMVLKNKLDNFFICTLFRYKYIKYIKYKRMILEK